MYKIYGLYCPEGHLRYIGFTSKTLNKRLQGHYNATRTKGRKCHRICWLLSVPEKVTIKLIASFTTRKEALQKEIYYIDFYRKQGCDLVNATLGGEGSNGHKWDEIQYLQRALKVCQYKTDGTLVAVYKSLSYASLILTGSQRANGKISAVCNGKYGRRTFKGFIFRYLNDDFLKYPVEKQHNVTEAQRAAIRKRQTENNCMKSRVGLKHPTSKQVEQLLLDGTVIAKFDSIREAQLSTQTFHIGTACRNNKIVGGFLWRFKDKDIVRTSE